MLDEADSEKLSVLAVACSISTFQPRFREPFLRPLRAVTFGSLAFFTMVPVVHGVYENGWEIQKQQMGINWVLGTLFLNTLGASAYAFKVCWHYQPELGRSMEQLADYNQVPERWFRRKFDIVGASHQIFHILVVIAALTYTRGMLQAFDFVHTEGNFVCHRDRTA
jgi:adiponectin receptor